MPGQLGVEKSWFFWSKKRGFLFSSLTVIGDVAVSLTADPPLRSLEYVGRHAQFRLFPIKYIKLIKVGCCLISCLQRTLKKAKKGEDSWLIDPTEKNNLEEEPVEKPFHMLLVVRFLCWKNMQEQNRPG